MLSEFSNDRGCSLTNGLHADTRTEAQKAAMRRLLEELHGRYPKAVIVGHCDLNPGKECPGYKYVAKEYADLQPK